ncbi:diaminopimelate decarboxylase [Clostridium taeniosporum]|uniref:Diaminopimelate decarboxylase n=1 Tax=Clostridium taeniosporum TaxID=394958 RepID=A0A1D7XNB6_9CLOT|nr:diaminopimelate decarboxylase [Clostridium taeniosporum]AOR24619.1 diaminopimelate decarboxylase [Clostridium taeniosporum]
MKLFGNMEIIDNELTIGGIKTTDLVKEYCTPLYVMDEGLIRQNCSDYYKYFKCEESLNRVAYAGKAFLTIEMCKIINEEKLSLDVVSGGELFTAYKSGFPLERVMFHGNNKTLDEIDFGVKLGVGRFVVDNYYEMESLNKIAAKYNKIQKIFLRITPGIEAHTHEYIKTGQIDSKFGFPPVNNMIEDAVNKSMEFPNIELVGLHCHIGSQIFEIEPYEDAVEIMLDLIKKIKQNTGYLIKELDLGGGFGIYYNRGDKPKTTKEYCEAILNKVDEVCSRTGQSKPSLIIEPGRSIVGNAGITLYTVGSIKNISGVRKYISVDGGMSDNIRPALYNAKYECMLANEVKRDLEELVTICGKCCESGDILLNDINISVPKSNDILAVMTTGAYGYSMSNNYNKIPRPPVVMIKDNKARLICKRETYEDLIKNEIV